MGRLANDAGTAGIRRLRLAWCFGGCGAGEGLRDLEEGHAQLEESVVEQEVLVWAEIAFGLIGEDSEHVDALACAEDVNLRLLAFGSGATQLHDGRHVDGLNEPLEVHWWEVVGARVGGADGGVETVGGGLVGGAG